MKFILTLLLLAVLIAGAAAAWMWLGMTQPYQNFPAEGVFVEIPHGTSQRYVAYLLKKNGVIRSATAFEIYARRHPRRSLQAGEYFFDHATDGREVFWKLASGDVYEQPFTVREGQTIFEIAQQLESEKVMPAKEFLRAANDPAAILDLSPGARTLEGFLFPATYHLPRHAVAADLAAEMVKKFREEWKNIASPLNSEDAAAAGGRPVSSIVALASLVERETPKSDERPLVAGVFDNRLRKGMPLQCDPTVIYALERQNKYRGTLSSADLRIDSPYNTYVHTGLPPGPIGNPGEASLRAALQPAQTDYLYFVANTQGGHFFSSTLAEHNNNVMKYRHLLANPGASSSPADAGEVDSHSDAGGDHDGHPRRKGVKR